MTELALETLACTLYDKWASHAFRGAAPRRPFAWTQLGEESRDVWREIAKIAVASALASELMS